MPVLLASLSGLFVKILYLLLYVAVLVLIGAVVVWILGKLGITVPARIQQIAGAILILLLLIWFFTGGGGPL